ncbi:MAG: META domain-containing protein, partial [Calditrichaceae bacterium]|nr:META domain-containing protein [Calditrichaceae bacterium]
NINYLIILLVIILSCSIFEPDNESKNLVGTTWKLIEIRNSDNHLIFKTGSDWSYWIKFQEDGSALAKDACNDCSGNYTKDGENIDISLSCTESACSTPPPSLGYSYEINHSISYEIDSDKLKIKVFYSNFGERILIHKAID